MRYTFEANDMTKHKIQTCTCLATCGFGRGSLEGSSILCTGLKTEGVSCKSNVLHYLFTDTVLANNISVRFNVLENIKMLVVSK